MNGGDETDGLVYEFVAAGESCERCQALSGTQWSEPPGLPHPHCECEIEPKLAGLHEPRECGDTTWSMEHLHGGTARYGPGGANFEWGFNVTIDCWDGATYEFEIWVDMGTEADYPGYYSEGDVGEMESFAWSEIYDQAEEVAAQVCRPCEPPLVA